MPAEFIEPAIVPDIVVSRIAYSQEIAPQMWRIAFYADQVCSLTGQHENVIVCKLVVHRTDMIQCIRTAVKVAAIRSFCWIG